jgi:hypothetical protein
MYYLVHLQRQLDQAVMCTEFSGLRHFYRQFNDYAKNMYIIVELSAKQEGFFQKLENEEWFTY